MKRKTIILMLLALLCYTTTFAQVEKTVTNLTAGDLTFVCTDKEKAQTTSLIITGEMNSVDFNTIKTEFVSITEINIQKVSIVKNAFLSAANTIPTKSLQILTLKKITLPETATDIEVGAFRGCSALQEVVMFNGMLNIKQDAFKWCPALNNIKLPNSLLTIGAGAFQGCTTLTEIAIPENVNSIGTNAFYNCPLLNKIEVLIKTPLVISSTVFSGSATAPGLNKGTCKMYVPNSSIDAYKGALVWKEFSSINGLDTSTAINYINNGDTKVWTNNNELFVYSNKVINNVELFAVTGQLLNKETVGTNNLKMNLTNGQISILKVNYQDGTSEVAKVRAN